MFVSNIALHEFHIGGPIGNIHPIEDANPMPMAAKMTHQQTAEIA
jgi:hypothetical protein